MLEEHDSDVIAAALDNRRQYVTTVPSIRAAVADRPSRKELERILACVELLRGLVAAMGPVDRSRFRSLWPDIWDAIASGISRRGSAQ